MQDVMELVGEQVLVGRRIYYISGFDPRGASFYYGLFSQQLKRFAEYTGRALSVGSRRKDGQSPVSRWRVKEDGPAAETGCDLDYCFLHWDDIVRRSWERNPLRLLGAGLVVYGDQLMQGVLWRIARGSLPGIILFLFPMLFAACAVVLAGLVGWLTFLAARRFAFLVPIHLVMASVICLGMLVLAWTLAERIGLLWFFRSMAFIHQLAGDDEGDLKLRLGELSEAILRLEESEPAAEILLVGHSNGTFVMAMLVAELRRHPDFASIAPRLSMLSLGQNLSLLAIQPRALSFRRDLEELVNGVRLPWRDVSSIDDFFSGRGVDPYLTCGLTAPSPPYPVVELISLSHRQGLTSLWQVINGQLGLHFEYLATAPPERRGGFDYLELLLQPVAEPALVRNPLP